MSKLVLAFSMSLDGFVAGPAVSVEEPMGLGGERLHDWIFTSADPVDKEMAGELAPTLGAVLVGRRTFDVGIGPWEDTPFPVPTFVLTHHKRPPLAMKSGTFTFVDDGIERALEQARSAAAGKSILVMVPRPRGNTSPPATSTRSFFSLCPFCSAMAPAVRRRVHGRIRAGPGDRVAGRHPP